MSDFFKNNLVYLRNARGENQTETATALGLTRSTLANYEVGINLPKIDVMAKIIGHFGVSFDELTSLNLENVHLNKKSDKLKNIEIVHPNVHPSVHLKPEKGQKREEMRITIMAEEEANVVVVPITDISVAAGGGVYNHDYVTNVESLRFPVQFLKKNSTYLCVKIKGVSMAPTLQDGGYVIIRLLDKSEWAKMPDERIYVVSDLEGKSYLKRVKNRFKQDFIVLKSDSPDQATFPSFNLTTSEINTIWYCEWYFSAKMPNIHDQYYSRLQRLEDKLEDYIHTTSKKKPIIEPYVRFVLFCAITHIG